MDREIHCLKAYRDAGRFDGRYLVLYGGAGSGKSYFAAQKLVIRCLQDGRRRALVIRKVGRTLQASTFQQIRDVMEKADISHLAKFNRAQSDIFFTNGAAIISAGLDDSEKLKSIAGITDIWIEEATELNPEDFTQVDLRLRGEPVGYQQIMMTFNPISDRHWLKRHFFDNPPPEVVKELKIVRTTYLDNPRIGGKYASALASLDERHRAIYERGEWGQLAKGLIYPEWDASELPDSDDPFYGLDFGFNNPTVLVQCAVIDSEQPGFYVDELLYESGLTNADLIARLEALGVSRYNPIYCDSAEPQRIEEIARAGFNALPADKSVNDGIDRVKQYHLYFTPRSVNLQNETQVYKWAEDRDGNVLDKPVKFADHGMDAMRYAVHTHITAAPSWLLSSWN